MGEEALSRGLLSVEAVRAHAGDARVRLLDVRWYLSGRVGRDAYRAGHVPGAVFVELETALANPETPGPGRHPLPSRARFEEAMRAAGVSRESFVVAYDDAGGSIAARLWWLLGHFGHADAAVLDGGIAAWGSPLEAGEGPTPARGDFSAGAPLPGFLAVDRESVRAVSEGRRGAVLLDARAPERYRGDAEPVDPRAGHVPGALSAPWSASLEGGVFKTRERLAAEFAARGVSEESSVIAYCGSGVTACALLLALDRSGFDPHRRALYEGSWSDWSRDPSLPAARGAAPRDE